MSTSSPILTRAKRLADRSRSAPGLYPVSSIGEFIELALHVSAGEQDKVPSLLEDAVADPSIVRLWHSSWLLARGNPNLQLIDAGAPSPHRIKNALPNTTAVCQDGQAA